MGEPEVVNNVVDFIVYSAVIPLGLFVGLYLTRSPWWVTDLGVAALSSKLSQLLVFLVIGFSLFLGPDYFGREWVRFIVYGLVVFSMWFDVVNLLRYQKAFPNGRRKAPARPPLIEMLKRYFRPPMD